MDNLLSVLFPLLNVLSGAAIISFVIFLICNSLMLQRNVSRLNRPVDELQQTILDRHPDRL